MIKRLIGAAAALVIAITSIGTMKVTANTTPDRESPIIYRTSHEGKNVKGEWTFTYALVARENGNIHIDIQISNYSLGSTYSPINEIGSLSFNDNMIAAVGEDGASGTSYFANAYPKIVSSFDNEQIIYTVFDSNGRNYSDIGRTITYFDLYVKEDYLNINQTINFFGEEVRIPFGENLVADDIDSLKARIAELEVTINTYETLLTSVSLERGDVNNDGFINAVDASQILAYYAYTSTGGHLDFMDFLEGKADKEES